MAKMAAVGKTPRTEAELTGTASAGREGPRDRILGALAGSCAEKGYAATTIHDIASGAGVSKRTFYEHFEGKEDCFRAAVDQFVSRATAAIERSRAGTGSWIEGTRAGIRSLLELMKSDPPAAKLVFLEALAAPPTRDDPETGATRTLQGLFAGAEGPQQNGQPPPEAAERAAIGGAQALLVDQLIADRAEDLPELLSELTYIVLVPYLGQEEAARHARPAGQNQHP